MIASVKEKLPWSTCSNEWNTLNCITSYNQTPVRSPNSSNITSRQATSAEEYFNRNLLGIDKSTGIDDLGPIKYDLAACLALVYVLMYLCICNGVKSTGKAVYVIFN